MERSKNLLTVRRIFLFLLILTLVAGQILPTGLSFAQNISEPTQKKFAAREEAIPQELGKLKSAHLINSYEQIFQSEGIDKAVGTIAADKQPFVILIEDAHASLEAQMNIANLIQHARRQWGVRLIALEGAEGKAPLEEVRAMPGGETKEEILDFYLREALLTGPEYEALRSPEAYEVIGVEEKGLYEADRQVYLELNDNRSEISRILSDTQKKLNRAKEAAYSKELLIFDGKERQFQKNSYRYFPTFVPYLVKLAGQKGIAIPEDSELAALARVMQDASEVSSANLEQELVSFKNEYPNFKKECDILEKRFLPRKNDFNFAVTGAPPEIPALFLFRYKALRSYLNLAELRYRMNSEKVFSEIDELSLKIKKLLSRGPEEFELDEETRELDLVGKILYLEARPEDLKTGFDLEAYSKQIGLSQLYKKARYFYELAEKRDETLALKTLTAIEESKVEPKAAVLVAGGFHAEGIQRVLEKMKISYIVLSPQFNADLMNDSLYRMRLKEDDTLVTSTLSQWRRTFRANFLNEYRSVYEYRNSGFAVSAAFRKVASLGNVSESSAGLNLRYGLKIGASLGLAEVRFVETDQTQNDAIADELFPKFRSALTEFKPWRDTDKITRITAYRTENHKTQLERNPNDPSELIFITSKRGTKNIAEAFRGELKESASQLTKTRGRLLLRAAVTVAVLCGFSGLAFSIISRAERPEETVSQYAPEKENLPPDMAKPLLGFYYGDHGNLKDADKIIDYLERSLRNNPGARAGGLKPIFVLENVLDWDGFKEIAKRKGYSFEDRKQTESNDDLKRIYEAELPDTSPETIRKIIAEGSDIEAVKAKAKLLRYLLVNDFEIVFEHVPYEVFVGYLYETNVFRNQTFLFEDPSEMLRSFHASRLAYFKNYWSTEKGRDAAFHEQLKRLRLRYPQSVILTFRGAEHRLNDAMLREGVGSSSVEARGDYQIAHVRIGRTILGGKEPSMDELIQEFVGMGIARIAKTANIDDDDRIIQQVDQSLAQKDPKSLEKLLSDYATALILMSSDLVKKKREFDAFLNEVPGTFAGKRKIPSNSADLARLQAMQYEISRLQIEGEGALWLELGKRNGLLDPKDYERLHRFLDEKTERMIKAQGRSLGQVKFQYDDNIGGEVRAALEKHIQDNPAYISIVSVKVESVKGDVRRITLQAKSSQKSFEVSGITNKASPEEYLKRIDEQFKSIPYSNISPGLSRRSMLVLIGLGGAGVLVPVLLNLRPSKAPASTLVSPETQSSVSTSVTTSPVPTDKQFDTTKYEKGQFHAIYSSHVGSEGFEQIRQPLNDILSKTAKNPLRHNYPEVILLKELVTRMESVWQWLPPEKQNIASWDVLFEPRNKESLQKAYEAMRANAEQLERSRDIEWTEDRVQGVRAFFSRAGDGFGSSAAFVEKLYFWSAKNGVRERSTALDFESWYQLTKGMYFNAKPYPKLFGGDMEGFLIEYGLLNQTMVDSSIARDKAVNLQAKQLLKEYPNANVVYVVGATHVLTKEYLLEGLSGTQMKALDKGEDDPLFVGYTGLIQSKLKAHSFASKEEQKNLTAKAMTESLLLSVAPKDWSMVRLLTYEKDMFDALERQGIGAWEALSRVSKNLSQEDKSLKDRDSGTQAKAFLDELHRLGWLPEDVYKQFKGRSLGSEIVFDEKKWEGAASLPAETVEERMLTLFTASNWKEEPVSQLSEQARLALLSKALSVSLQRSDAEKVAQFLRELIERSADSPNIYLPEAIQFINSYLTVYSMPKSKVGIVIPMYKERQRIQPKTDTNPHGEDFLRIKIRQIRELFKINPKVTWQMILVEDGEHDMGDADIDSGSAGLAKEILKNEYPELVESDHVQIMGVNRTIKDRLKGRKGTAVIYGMQRALENEADYVIFTDADISTDVAFSGLILKPLLEGTADAAIGSRRMPGSIVYGRSNQEKRSSSVFNFLVRQLLPLPFSDTQTGFKAFKRAILKRTLPVEQNKMNRGRFMYDFAFDTNLLVRIQNVGGHIQEVPITWIGSPYESKIRWQDPLIMAYSVWKQRAFVTAPGAIATYNSDIAGKSLGTVPFSKKVGQSLGDSERKKTLRMLPPPQNPEIIAASSYSNIQGLNLVNFVEKLHEGRGVTRVYLDLDGTLFRSMGYLSSSRWFYDSVEEFSEGRTQEYGLNWTVKFWASMGLETRQLENNFYQLAEENLQRQIVELKNRGFDVVAYTRRVGKRDKARTEKILAYLKIPISDLYYANNDDVQKGDLLRKAEAERYRKEGRLNPALVIDDAKKDLEEAIGANPHLIGLYYDNPNLRAVDLLSAQDYIRKAQKATQEAQMAEKAGKDSLEEAHKLYGQAFECYFNAVVQAQMLRKPGLDPNGRPSGEWTKMSREEAYSILDYIRIKLSPLEPKRVEGWYQLITLIEKLKDKDTYLFYDERSRQNRPQTVPSLSMWDVDGVERQVSIRYSTAYLEGSADKILKLKRNAERIVTTVTHLCDVMHLDDEVKNWLKIAAWIYPLGKGYTSERLELHLSGRAFEHMSDEEQTMYQEVLSDGFRILKGDEERRAIQKLKPRKNVFTPHISDILAMAAFDDLNAVNQPRSGARPKKMMLPNDEVELHKRPDLELSVSLLKLAVQFARAVSARPLPGLEDEIKTAPEIRPWIEKKLRLDPAFGSFSIDEQKLDKIVKVFEKVFLDKPPQTKLAERVSPPTFDTETSLLNQFYPLSLLVYALLALDDISPEVYRTALRSYIKEFPSRLDSIVSKALEQRVGAEITQKILKGTIAVGDISDGKARQIWQQRTLVINAFNFKKLIRRHEILRRSDTAGFAQEIVALEDKFKLLGELLDEQFRILRDRSHNDRANNQHMLEQDDSRVTYLIVDDRPVFNFYLQAVVLGRYTTPELRRRVQIVPAKDTMDAQEKLKNLELGPRDYLVCILDLQMPVMDDKTGKMKLDDNAGWSLVDPIRTKFPNAVIGIDSATLDQIQKNVDFAFRKENLLYLRFLLDIAEAKMMGSRAEAWESYNEPDANGSSLGKVYSQDEITALIKKNMMESPDEAHFLLPSSLLPKITGASLGALLQSPKNEVSILWDGSETTPDTRLQYLNRLGMGRFLGTKNFKANMTNKKLDSVSSLSEQVQIAAKDLAARGLTSEQICFLKPNALHGKSLGVLALKEGAPYPVFLMHYLIQTGGLLKNDLLGIFKRDIALGDFIASVDRELERIFAEQFAMRLRAIAA